MRLQQPDDAAYPHGAVVRSVIDGDSWGVYLYRGQRLAVNWTDDLDSPSAGRVRNGRYDNDQVIPVMNVDGTSVGILGRLPVRYFVYARDVVPDDQPVRGAGCPRRRQHVSSG